MLEALIVVAALAIPVAAIAGFIVALNVRGRVVLLEQRIRELERRGLTAAAGDGAAGPAADDQAAISALPTTAPAEPVAPPPAPEPTAPEPAAAPEAAAPSPAPARPRRSFEESFGTRWTVWVGGLALALGGLFLLRYSIEQGLLGPAARIGLAALFALALIAAGERTRRQDRAQQAGFAAAHVPSILTAAGTTIAYGAVYAAYDLYGFLPPALAFVLLGAVALATLAAALLHGPALAALGLVGAYVAPGLVTTSDPNAWALYLYVAVVTAAAFGLARLRLWRWLALTAIAFGLAWGLVWSGTPAPHLFHAVAGFVLSAALIVAGFLYGPPSVPGRIEATSSIALAAYLAGAAFVVLVSGHDAAALIVFTALAVATVALVWRAEAAAGALPAAAVFAAAILADWALDAPAGTLVAPPGPMAGVLPEPSNVVVWPHLAFAVALAILFAAVGFRAQGRASHAGVSIIWAATAVFAPLAMFGALYYRIADFERSIPFAGLALVMAAAFGAAVEALSARPSRPGLTAGAALFATGAVAALALAFTVALEKGWLTIALALMIAGVAWTVERRPVPFLRWLAAAMSVIVLMRLGWEPRVVGNDVGAAPLFNWLLYGYGVPALACWFAAHRLRRGGDDVPTRMVEALAITFTVLAGALQIRHYVHGGDVYRPASDLMELALQVCLALAMAIGLERLRQRSGSIVHNIGALVMAALAACAALFGLLGAENPALTGTPVGGPVINLVLLGYGLPAALAAILAVIVRAHRPPWYSVAAAVAALVLGMAYITLEIRTLFRGPDLTAADGGAAELYAYSAAWLAFGVLLLAAGIVRASRTLRLASAAVLVVTIVKVFLVDLADLEGIYRALSFIGLGLVLVGIGRLYQKLLFPPRREGTGTAASQTGGAA